jgi:hypothetical protein
MLVGAFQIQIGDAVGAAIGAVAQHEGMGRAAVEPHIQHVHDLIVGVGVDDARPASRSLKPSRYQTSAPSASNAAMMRALTSGSRSRKSASVGRAPFFTKQVSGTPQARWRDSTQSGRFSTIECSRLRPVCGVHLTSWSIEVSARVRIVVAIFAHAVISGLSMAANHCGVLR